MAKQTINAKVRTSKGKVAAKRLRKVGSIPSVMYNEKGESTMLEVNEVEFNKVWRAITSTTAIDLNVDGKVFTAVIKDVEYNIRNDKVLHADFFVPAKDEKLKYRLKVHFSGNAAGVLKGGFLLKHAPDVTFVTTIDNLPEKIVLDVSNMNIGDSLKVKDLNLGKNVTILTAPETELVSISPAR